MNVVWPNKVNTSFGHSAMTGAYDSLPGFRPQLDVWLLNGEYRAVQRLPLVLPFEDGRGHSVFHAFATDAVSLAASEFSLAASSMSLAAWSINLEASEKASCRVLGVA